MSESNETRSTKIDPIVSEPKVEYGTSIKGYQPTKGKLNPAKPPQGGTGVPIKQGNGGSKQ